MDPPLNFASTFSTTVYYRLSYNRLPKRQQSLQQIESIHTHTHWRSPNAKIKTEQPNHMSKLKITLCSNIRIVSTMPTLRLVYLTEQQYAGMTDHAHAHANAHGGGGGGGAANNNTTTAEEQQLPSISNQEQTTRLVTSTDATSNASSSKKSDHEAEDNDYLDTLLQESIDAVNSRSCSFGDHAVRYHQQVQQEMALSSDKDSKNDSTSSECVRVRVVDALQQFQHETVSLGNKRKRRAPRQSFDDRFNDLMAFKAKYGHCDVSCTGENAFLGAWCSKLRVSYKKIQNHQKPNKKLSDEQIQRLDDAGFKLSLNLGFDDRLNDLMAFEA
jgi:hypothetical protein